MIEQLKNKLILARCEQLVYIILEDYTRAAMMKRYADAIFHYIIENEVTYGK